ncbi:nicotinate-nucleotide--dimethylbenzimidazole phosphoribosyltransferase [Thiospirochaeta perfilievii]|uniref:Nicotinate-nucleotide--dimethylbenzimidazole phosphoribosyltransferase n=1 Tax=Thiospirochaeta perfilievii TaxID=252967 RepID=A0A5C1QCK3_9SPIO|nr:nicotinate-nucleotide--dimethylbenzimidazole phosphoribosyltransferase [Thiospirochaeta perfilievii]QEN03912.1 nicotinate-nucleotide--dimethylbenzimidazole phosphoribosyltransferase [Thiospirochaeta perfilievii]
MSLIEDINSLIKPLDLKAMEGARVRQNRLTKPPGSLGRLEELSINVAGIKGEVFPHMDNKAILTFAGDHHVVFEEGIASAPMEVTAMQVDNFVRGGGAVNVLAKHAGARVVVIDMGVATPYKSKTGVKNKFVASGAKNISKGPAMSRDEAIKSVIGGIETVLEEIDNGLDIVGIGEMGIGNTTPSSAIFSLYTGLDPIEITGPGAGIDSAVLDKKVNIVKRALEVNNPNKDDMFDVLSKIGGFEIGGMVGAIICCAAKKIPVVIDGFISTAAGVLATSYNPLISDYLFLSHKSAETGYKHVFDFFKTTPILDLGLRLGEGTGAALGISIIDAAVKSLKDISTFEEAGIVL